MQIDLFKSRTYNSSYHKLGNSVEKRQFELDPSLGTIDDLDKHVVCYDKQQLESYKSKLKSLVDSGREYQHIGLAGSDSLFEVEALGIAKYCKRYTLILDLSDSLDYMLHRLCKCNMSAIRGIPEYSKISRAIMNYDFEDVGEILFNTFFQVDPRLDAYLVSMLTSSDNVTISSESKMDWVVNNFYTAILNTSVAVRDYTMQVLSSKLPRGTFAYRSKNFSSSLAAIEEPFDDKIVFHQEGYEDYVVDVSYYAPFGYAKRRVFL